MPIWTHGLGLVEARAAELLREEASARCPAQQSGSDTAAVTALRPLGRGSAGVPNDVVTGYPTICYTYRCGQQPLAA